MHGDLSGNMLFSDGKPAVVIDFSPFWRHVDYAAAIAVVDGIADFGEGEGVLRPAGLGWDGDGLGRHGVQMVVRALVFRVVARSELVGGMGEVGEREMKGFERVMGVIERMSDGEHKGCWVMDGGGEGDEGVREGNGIIVEMYAYSGEMDVIV